jgi:uncharacterized protein (TIGR02687 family)
MSKIKQSIEKLFQKHRILIWYDPDQAFTEEYEELVLEDAQKVRVAGNEWAIKVQILYKEPGQKFLLYLPKERPKDEENWLLDVELAHRIYQTDKESLYLQEVGLGYHYKGWIQNHIAFFKSKKRVAKFGEIAEEEDGDHKLSLKLLQVVFNADTLSIDQFLKNYASAFVNGKSEDIERELERFGLQKTFWQEVTRKFGYQHDQPTIYDFLLEAFKQNFTPTVEQAAVNRETEVLLSTWKDTLSFQTDFRSLSGQIEQDLHIEEKLNEAGIEEIIEDDVFELIDRKIISDLVRGILNESIDRKRLESLIKKRESTYWFGDYEEFYLALSEGFELLEYVKGTDQISIENFDQGIEHYVKEWHRIDRHYRSFLTYYRQANQNRVLSRYYEAVNKAYSNNWLLKLGDTWQRVLDDTGGWPTQRLDSQKNFFKREVKPFIEKGNRLFVIVSDALRYECGVAFFERMQRENRFENDLGHQVSLIPSFTQLGMATLLPNEKITFSETGLVSVDGQRTDGKAYRKKVLNAESGAKSTTIGAEEVMKYASNSEEARDLVTNHDLIYIYHNRIDKVGDDLSSEDKVIEAAHEEVAFLVDLVKKVTNMGGVNVIVTADHGFIYQHDDLDESDFADPKLTGDTIKVDRRFVLGRNLSSENNMIKYAAKDIGIDDDTEVLIPKGINRLRKSGAGARFVHGGTALQEVVVPIIRINKKKEDTVKKVEVDVLNKRSNRISTNIQRVTFYQTDAVDEKVIPRTLKMQFQSEDGETLSDVTTYTFDSKSEKAEEREFDYRFQLSSKASTEHKNETVYLVLEEQVQGSNTWVEYQRYPYTINISFTNDFDDF